METKDKTKVIAKLNDAFRQTFTGGRVMMTERVQALEDEQRFKLFNGIRSVSDFDKANDPHGEHDFGSIGVSGEKYFWKIDYYNPSLDGGSEDPSDLIKTARVMTIMHASEY